jgi:glucosamine--fructose-6-phosphate aminotransferase (isomerizing)
MCSVIGYIGTNKSSTFVLEGLSRLEYRGYDSVGFAWLAAGNTAGTGVADTGIINYVKAIEGLTQLSLKFAELDNKSDFKSNPDKQHYMGIGHSRWATHGRPSELNAHPHFDCQKSVAVAHNGIIENYLEIKQELARDGHVFASDTDTEVVAHLLESLISQKASARPTAFKANPQTLVTESDGLGHSLQLCRAGGYREELKNIVVQLLARLEGAYAFMIMLNAYSDTLLVVRRRSPLCVGIGQEEMFVASDAFAFAGKTKQVVYIPDETFALIHKDGMVLYDFAGNALPVPIESLELDWLASDKQGYEHFMLKEIHEQKKALYKTVDYAHAIQDSVWDHLGLSATQVQELRHINLIGCGTSWHAARMAQFFLESLSGVSVSVYLASEFRYMPFFPSQNSIYIAVSQSGETADTLEALRLINSFGLPTVALTNVASSTMVREAGGFLLTQAGREIAVASTKAFTTQLAALYWLANRIGLEKGVITAEAMAQVRPDVYMAADMLEACIAKYESEITQHHAKKYAHYTKAIFLGRNISYPFAMEAALKLKEIAYVFAQCYPAGELKHGPLALIDAQTPVFIFSHQDPLIYQKLVSNAQEVKARNGHIITFLFEGQHELAALADLYFEVPNQVNPLLGHLAMTGLMQFFVYAVAKELGCPIDKPRNLAKSVTVE